MKIDKNVEERFWSKVSKCECDKCWEWTASLNSKGYGRMNMQGRTGLSHRLSWLIHFSEIPDGLDVLHHCDNPKCVNPNHLFLGTHSDNMRDMVKKGRNGAVTHPERLSRGDAHYSRTRPHLLCRGDNHPSRIDSSYLPSGDDHWMRKFPERRLYGDRNPSRTNPEKLARGDHNGSRLHPERLKRGKEHPQAKLDEDKVRGIKLRLSNGERAVDLADEFGVHRKAIYNIITKRSWAHV